MDIEQYSKCDRMIDPLREVMFAISKAYDLFDNKCLFTIAVEDAKVWLYRAKGYNCPKEAVRKLGEYIKEVEDAINDENALIEAFEEILPAVIDVVFRTFLQCYLGELEG